MARVLICEPHDDISALLELVVRRLGHEPVAYVCGDEIPAVDAAVIEPGELGALDAARHLRAHDVPVLFTSIYAPAPAALDLAPAAYLVKPFGLCALEHALAEALGGAPAPSLAFAV